MLTTAQAITVVMAFGAASGFIAAMLRVEIAAEKRRDRTARRALKRERIKIPA